MRTLMSARLAGLMIDVGAGFVISWARLSDPAVIRDMLMLRDPSRRQDPILRHGRAHRSVCEATP